MDETKFRARILSLLGAGALVAAFMPVACGDSTKEKSDTQPSCSSGKPTVSCFPPGQTHFNQGETLPDASVPDPEPTFDENECQVREEVRDGCCNSAQTGPDFIDGECCYGFCTGSCCGRPLLIDGSARVAKSTSRRDWSSGTAEDFAVAVAELSPRERTELGSSWRDEALLEHASIASFARFCLDLLAWGAPPDLVRDAIAAASDEVRHAEECFEIASHYLGERVGPSALPLAGVGASGSLLEATLAAVREGCVGESLAALVLAERARGAALPRLREKLERIANDEARHAELAWRFVAWALGQGDEPFRAAVTEAFRALSVEARPARQVVELAGLSADVLHAHGRLTEGETLEIERRALFSAIDPCARALCAARG